MHATIHRNEGVDTKRIDGLSHETGEAVVRDLLDFEGFRSYDTWRMKRPSWERRDRITGGLPKRPSRLDISHVRWGNESRVVAHGRLAGFRGARPLVRVR